MYEHNEALTRFDEHRARIGQFGDTGDGNEVGHAKWTA
jgi:hypothetical protein